MENPHRASVRVDHSGLGRHGCAVKAQKGSKKMFRKTLHTLLLLAPLPALAQPAAPPAPSDAPPRLIIAISVDQFSADLFNEYRPYYSGGLKRLGEGALFSRG